ncbi:MAG: hypothetical protein J07AB43_06640, partial [Candidatus Nanosalina sp. J07AB43]
SAQKPSYLSLFSGCFQYQITPKGIRKPPSREKKL